jgi:hypothetical protein
LRVERRTIKLHCSTAGQVARVLEIILIRIDQDTHGVRSGGQIFEAVRTNAQVRESAVFASRDSIFVADGDGHWRTLIRLAAWLEREVGTDEAHSKFSVLARVSEIGGGLEQPGKHLIGTAGSLRENECSDARHGWGAERRAAHVGDTSIRDGQNTITRRNQIQARTMRGEARAFAIIVDAADRERIWIRGRVANVAAAVVAAGGDHEHARFGGMTQRGIQSGVAGVGHAMPCAIGGVAFNPERDVRHPRTNRNGRLEASGDGFGAGPPIIRKDFDWHDTHIFAGDSSNSGRVVRGRSNHAGDRRSVRFLGGSRVIVTVSTVQVMTCRWCRQVDAVGHVEQAGIVTIVEHGNKHLTGAHLTGIEIVLPGAWQSDQAQVRLQRKFWIIRAGGIHRGLSLECAKFAGLITLHWRIKEPGGGLFGNGFQASRLELVAGHENPSAQFVITGNRWIAGVWQIGGASHQGQAEQGKEHGFHAGRLGNGLLLSSDNIAGGDQVILKFANSNQKIALSLENDFIWPDRMLERQACTHLEPQVSNSSFDAPILIRLQHSTLVAETIWHYCLEPTERLGYRQYTTSCCGVLFRAFRVQFGW